MKIINLHGESIKACFVFVVGNCEISVSTVFNANRPEIVIFDKSNDAMLKDKLSTIGSAIAWVDSFGPRD